MGIVYYAATDGSARQLSGYISTTTNALAREPLLYAGAVNDPARPMFENYGDSNSPRADFVGAAYDRTGQVWGGLVKQLGPPDASNRIATTGYVAHLMFRLQRAR